MAVSHKAVIKNGVCVCVWTQHKHTQWLAHVEHDKDDGCVCDKAIVNNEGCVCVRERDSLCARESTIAVCVCERAYGCDMCVCEREYEVCGVCER